MITVGKLYGNDRITKLLDWLYIGGTENNVLRTLPYVDIWINFSHQSKREMLIKNKSNTSYTYYPLRFDDGDIYQGQDSWLKAYEIINENKNKKVLISCSEGVSRSAVMALWILCEEFGNFEVALNHLRSNRKIYIDNGFNDFVDYLKEIYK